MPTFDIRDRPSKYGYEKRKYIYPSGRPDPVAPAAAPAPAPQPNPLEGYRNIDEYASGMKRQSAGGTLPMGPNPMADMQPVKAPGVIGDAYLNPFDSEGTGGYLGINDWENLKSQMGMIHRPSDQIRGKQYGDNQIARTMGGVVPSPYSMESMMNGTATPHDEIARENPDSIPMSQRIINKKDFSKAMHDWAKWKTANSGRLTLDNVYAQGDRLVDKYPNIDGALKNQFEKDIQQDPSLKNEFDQRAMTGESPTMGNPTFQGLPQEKQDQYNTALDMAADMGFQDPELMKALGFTEVDGRYMVRKAGIVTDKDGKQSIGMVENEVTSEDVAEFAERKWGRGGEVQAAPEQPQGTGTITGADVQTTSYGAEGITGGHVPQGADVDPASLPGIIGVAETPNGKVLTLIGGGIVDKKSAQKDIDDILKGKDGNPVTPEMRGLARHIGDMFGIKVPRAGATREWGVDKPVEKEGSFKQTAEDGTEMTWDPFLKEWTPPTPTATRPPSEADMMGMIYKSLKILAGTPKAIVKQLVARERRRAQAAWDERTAGK